MISSQLPALVIVLPLLLAPALALLRGRIVPWVLALLASGGALAAAIAITAAVADGAVLTYDMGGWPAPFGIELRITGFSALLLLVTGGASTLTLLAGRELLEQQVGAGRLPFFYAAWLLALGGLNGIVASGDAFNIFVFMEVSSLATYILVSAGNDRRALPAVFKYLVMGTLGATFFLIGVGLIYMMTGTLNIADMQDRIASVGDVKPVLAAAGFITVGLALKAGIFPLHVWLPNTYAYAPHPVTAFVAACSTKVSLYVLLRFDFILFQGNLPEHAEHFAPFMLPLAVLGILVGSAVAVREPDLKRLLAWSSIAQIGYMMLGASMMSQAGLTAGILHMFNHALAKGALFLAVAGLGLRCSGLRLDDLAGIAQRMPWTCAALLLSLASLVGIPGTAGFISKWYLILAALGEGGLSWPLVAVIVASSLLAVAYGWRIVEALYFRAPAPPTAEAREPPASMLLWIWVAALANLWFGLFPALPQGLAAGAAENLLGFLQ